ncbi:mRNA capping enzyme, alpha subunit [Sistotremastrum suecicum HHB10207 ss-3]|uniref:mRNA-capping enzyme subunit alpha n=1 Tax=Sistotremastrum suecicum HHB10207 ss-3 TaxID=1314776 RepID=A0A166A8E2_9AGAM|nr:mRNA capping enzyme, alpha subunit [Sistotremastrum suecicum HHB10207 ss-3]
MPGPSSQSKTHSAIPDIPGDLIPDDRAEWLRQRVAELCHSTSPRFPGSQPVSFRRGDLEKLENDDFWVCEKSDGIRVLVFVLPGGSGQDTFLIDRHNKYRIVQGFVFPHHTDPRRPLRASILDGELVLDTDRRTGKETLRLLIFDCLVIDQENVMAKSLTSRTGRLKEYLFKPYDKMLAEFPQMAESQPFEIRLKKMQLSYYVDQVLEIDIPNLQHGNDGLIYTCASSGYVMGTDQNIMKWKPPSENSIDFKLSLRFPPLPNSSKPDFCAKPVFVLLVWTGGKGAKATYNFFDLMHVTDEEWEEMKASGEQFDDRIIEVVWIPTPIPRWKMMRFRDDKPDGNYVDIVESICKSISEGVEKEELLSRSQSIKAAWKERAARGPTNPHPHPNPQSSQSSQRPTLPPTSSSSSYQYAQTSAAPLRRPPAPVPLYGPLAESPWSRVSGPVKVNGLIR